MFRRSRKPRPRRRSTRPSTAPLPYTSGSCDFSPRSTFRPISRLRWRLCSTGCGPCQAALDSGREAAHHDEIHRRVAGRAAGRIEAGAGRDHGSGAGGNRDSRLGWLPNPRSARVLYAGVEASEALTALAAATEQAVGEHRCAVRRSDLSPARDAGPNSQASSLGALKHALAEIELSAIGSFRASSFALYLSAAGKYTKLQEFSFDT